jgi:hypothetical protein
MMPPSLRLPIDKGKRRARFFAGTAFWVLKWVLLFGGCGLGGGWGGGAAGLGAGKLGVFLLEAFDAAGGVDELLLAGVEGVADAADFDLDVLEVRAGFEGVSAGAADFRKVVLGVDFLFHGILFVSKANT